LKPEYYSKDDRYYFYSEIVFLKWPEYYYGIGANTLKDDEEEYTINKYGVLFTGQRKFISGLYLGINCDYSYVKFSKTEIGGMLESETVTGSKDGDITGIGLTSRYDTRDMIFFPGNGNYHQLKINSYGSDLGGDYTFKRYTLDLRRYFTLTDNQYVAVQTLGDFIDGNPPFTILPRVGDIVRGYYPTRYTDKNLLALQIEYRLVPLWKRFGIVLFSGIGGVAPKISDFEADNFKFAAGFGIRYIFVEDEKLNLRVDIGFGESGAEFYMDIAEAF
jgi:outer membrane protein assembly factor BamA